MTKIENALMWLYLKTWGLQGQHVLDKDELWNFGSEDLKTAIIEMAYPQKKMSEQNYEMEDDLVESLKKLIMGKFDEKSNEFYDWSRTIHNEVRIVPYDKNRKIRYLKCESYYMISYI